MNSNNFKPAMFTFLAFVLFGLYHLYITNPQAFDRLKVAAIFGIIHSQMLIEYTIANGKKIWHACEKYVQKNLIPREKIFSNEHILECTAISYHLNDSLGGSMVRHQFTKKDIDEGKIIRNNSIIITEIKFDTLDVVRLIYHYGRDYSMKNMQELIENQFVGGYPEPLHCPFICVDVVYADNRYDITGMLKEYLYSGNNILSLGFIRMLMLEHLDVFIKPNTPFSIHTVDHEVKMNNIYCTGDEGDGSYYYKL